MADVTIITPSPWAKVLTLAKDALDSEAEVATGVRLGSVSIPALLRMADRHPYPQVSIAVSPVEEIDDGEHTFF